MEGMMIHEQLNFNKSFTLFLQNFTPVQIFHKYPGDEFQLRCKFREPQSKAGLVALNRRPSLAVQGHSPWDTLSFSNWELLCAVPSICDRVPLLISF